MTTRTDQLLDVHATDGTGLIFLSDRFGDLGDGPIPGSGTTRFQAAGLSADDVTDLLSRTKDAFQDEACFLVHCEPTCGLPHTGPALLLEWDIDPDNLPDGDDAAEWRDAISKFAPALRCAANAVRDARAEGAKAWTLFNFDSCYGGAVCILMTIDGLAHYQRFFDALHFNGQDFPPSAHARFGSLAGLTWYPATEHVAADWLPGHPARVGAACDG